METNIRAGMRVLYKQGNSNWMIGTILTGNAEVNHQGIFVPIVPKGKDKDEEVHYAALTQLFTDCIPLETWMKDMLVSKEEYINFIQSDEFEKNTEQAWVSDGEYYYYPVSKYNEIWINKQPFDYILRG